MNDFSEQRTHPDRVKIMGLDFGSTTSSAMVAVADVGLNTVTGRMSFGERKILYRSDTEFTPFKGEDIDEEGITRCLDKWMHESRIDHQDLFSGGVIITGLAARQQNSSAIARLVRKRIGKALIATVDDPNLESWLAFMGCVAALSRYHSDRTFINLDIGGGTTNPAAGRAGQVLSAGCFYIGARHVQFEPGTYRITKRSVYGRKLMDHLSIGKSEGDVLDPVELDAILDYYIQGLEAMAAGDTVFFTHGIGPQLQQTPFAIPKASRNTAITFSGGVGELIYGLALGKEAPGTTYYGDMGIDMARAIVASPVFFRHIQTFKPENMGRATVYGLTLHNTEISGTTIFLPDPEILPVSDVPIVARLGMDCSRQEMDQAFSMVRAHRKGACIQILPDQEPDKGNLVSPSTAGSHCLAQVKRLGSRIADGLRDTGIPHDLPVVFLVPGNYGKALGNYATNWQESGATLIVIDEIPDRNAHFVNIGRSHRHIVPVSFYGLN